MSGYTKLFSSIVASTIWRADHLTRIVWITMLAMADRNGVVEGSIPGLADLARVPVAACRKALKELESPDEDSRSKDHEGRRILSIDGGWQLVNHAKYRAKMSADDRREYLRQKQAEHRARQHAVNIRRQISTESTHTDPAPEADPDPKAKAGGQDHAPSALVTAPPSAVSDNPPNKSGHKGQTPNGVPKQKPLYDGHSARRHGQHAMCFIERGLCVTPWVWEELLGRRGGERFASELRLWFSATVEEMRDVPLGDLPDDFWRNRFAEQWPPVTSKPKAAKATSQATEAELDALRAKGIRV